MERRRGVLLLVVLSTLIVFLLLGTLLLTQSTRSRTAARAFATMNASSASNGALARDVLDEALMQLIRGTATDDQTDPSENSILLDKYHTPGRDTDGDGSLDQWSDGPLSGEAIGIQYWPTNVRRPLLKVVINSLKDLAGTSVAPNYEALNGRIMTFLSPASKAGTQSSYRILRTIASSGNYECYLANMSPAPGSVLPIWASASETCPVHINDPEFQIESHDSFTDDIWLTEIRNLDQGIPKVLRPAFEATSSDGNGDGVHDSLDVDNDGDGLPDGVWRNPRIFQDRILSDGTQFEFDVSYLVRDLDSRLNINAHSMTPFQDVDWNVSSLTNPSLTQSDLDKEPPGLGWGVADVQARWAFPTATFPHRVWSIGAKGLTLTGRTSDANDGPTAIRHPYIGTVAGRFGHNELPGQTEAYSLSPFELLLYKANMLGVDLKSLAKVVVADGQLSYLFPTNTTYVQYPLLSSPPKPSEFAPFQYQNSPYKMRLDHSAGRVNERDNSYTRDAIFSLTELERVLRLYDNNANALPQRLAALLHSDLEQSQQIITTDSWDTPAIVGKHPDDSEPIKDKIVEYFRSKSLDPYVFLSPDVSAGLRFDINRPCSTHAQKQRYCKDLFVLLVSLGAQADADLAQWVVNVMDYRDPDSTITSFEWDEDFTDGWDPESNATNPVDPTDPSKRNPVFGSEKPELVLAQTLGWNDPPGQGSDGELFAVIYRPKGESVRVPGSSSPIEYAPLDEALSVSSTDNDLDLGKILTGGDATTPIWRLHYYELSDPDDPFSITGPEKYVLFSTVGTLEPNHNLNPNVGPIVPHGLDNASASQITPSNDEDHLGPGDYLVVGPDSSTQVTVDTTDQRVAALPIEYGAEMQIDDAGRAGNGRYVVTLERLRDPDQAFDITNNPYVPIDSVSVKWNNKNSNYKSFARQDPDFWETPQTAVNDNPNSDRLPYSDVLNPTQLKPLSWPNRPFISQVELACIPPGTGRDIFDNIRLPVPSDDDYYYLTDTDPAPFNNAVTGETQEQIAERLLAVTYVPSRFKGSSIKVTPSDLSSVGFENWPADAPQLPTWREAGRVNVNLVPREVAPASGYEQHRVWKALLGKSVTDSVAGASSPFSSAESIHELLAVNETDQLYFDTASSQSTEHPVLGYRTAIKLGNVGTIRSNVFAVWITLRVTNTQTQATTSHRLFAIVDRSIPVAFAPGQNLNSANTIRLKRYLD